MSGFKDLSEVFDSTLRLPIQGKTYSIPAVDAETGLYIQLVTGVVVKASGGADISAEEIDSIKLADEVEKDLYRRVLGGVYDELLQDGLDWEQLKLVGVTAIIRAASGMDEAEEYWNSGGRPKAPKKAPTDRNRSAKKGRQGSPAGTTKKSKAAASTGVTSSPTGT